MVPVLTVVVVVVLGLYFDGRAANGPGPLRDIFGAANPFNAILWGALAGCIVAIGLATTQRILTLKEALDGWLAGVKAMTMGFVILILAWSLGEVTKQVATAPYLTQLLEGNLSPELLPALTFVTAAVVSFCTGTSWATMTVLIPLVIPLILALGGVPDLAGGFGGTLLVVTVSSVMAGSIFGDHCSPISDTTVLSSMASACDHMDHVPDAASLRACRGDRRDGVRAPGSGVRVADAGGVCSLDRRRSWPWCAFVGKRVPAA